jgi:hypothetical protein
LNAFSDGVFKWGLPASRSPFCEVNEIAGVFMQLSLEEAGNQMVVKFILPGMKIVSKDPFNFSGNDKLGLKIKAG